MLKYQFRIDENKREIMPESTWDFPYLRTGTWLNAAHSAPWHWHPALEIVYIIQGTAVYSVPQADVIVPPDGILFINSGVFHAARAQDTADPVEYRCHIVDPSLLANGEGSAIKTKYVDPVIKCAALPYRLILPGEPMHAKALALLKEACEIADSGAFMHEYHVQQRLSRFWLMLIDETQAIWRDQETKNDFRNERVKKMLSFIQQNCVEKLTLEQIAASADISTRECLRCFQSMLKMTPFDYLIDCRVRKAADMLQNSAASMTDVALSCGFSSSSYFCRIFRKVTGQSPSQFRRGLSTESPTNPA